MEQYRPNKKEEEMKHEKISFRLVAYTDAAGKFSPDVFRNGNEDNFFVDDNLADPSNTKVSQDEVISLGPYGMLMAVADGMGGANAGEVASQIAVDTIKMAFKAEMLSSSSVKTVQWRQRYLEQTIRTADKNIKSEAKKDKSKEGMGSTIIIAWLYENELTISWCGDSRAYLFNEKSGIRLVSQDHSYVQELVNKGLLTYDQTFDHPQNNIVTRSLGDPIKDAKPESKTLKVGKGDIILLCSDGLSGVLRDRKMYGTREMLHPDDNIEDILRANTDSMKKCREALWVAAERNEWYDNVTAILCQITDGPENQWIEPLPASEQKDFNKKTKRNYILLVILFLVLAIMTFFIGLHIGKNVSIAGDDQPIVLNPDSIAKEDSASAMKDEPTMENKKVEEVNNPSTTDNKGEGANSKAQTIQSQIRQQNESKSDSASKESKLTEIGGDVKDTRLNEIIPPIESDKKAPSIDASNKNGRNDKITKP